MLWLGSRKFARLQVTGGTSGEDLMVAGPSVMPEALADWFRPRPSGALLNLMRKELRLLRPVWVIELMVVVYLTGLAIFRLLPSPPVFLPETVLQWAVLGPTAMTCMGLVGLAGILSLGEERRSGTQAWHMTLPISARTQWLIKLLVAMFAGLACSLLFPLLVMVVVGSVYGSPFMFVYLPAVPDLFILYPILTFSSFDLSPLALAGVTDYARSKVLWLFVPTLLFALLQSYRLFRTPPQNSKLWTLRCLLPVIAITLLWSFSATAGFLSSHWEPFEETRQALDQFQPTTAKLELTGEKLARASSMTVLTQRWLRGSSITVAPDRSHLPGYLATIHLASGLECRMIVVHSGGKAASCAPKGP